MSWKKNVFSYILWLANALAISVVGMLGLVGVVCEDLGYSSYYSFLINGIYFLIVGLFVLLVHKLTKRKPQRETPEIALLIPEGLLFVGLLAAGIVLRVMQLSQPELIGSVSDMEYFEAAKVVAGNTIPQVVHGATYVFLQLLHLVLLFVGNKFMAALWLQLVLACLGGILLYFAVRKLAGRLPALIMLGFGMLSPYMLESTLRISAEAMFLVIYAIVLWAIAGTLPRNRCNPFAYVFVGLLMGVCCYLDLAGVTLFVFAAGVFTVEREAPARLWNKRGMVFGLNVLGALIGWCGITILDAVLSGKQILNVMAAWLRLYDPEGFTLWPEGIMVSSAMKANAVVLFAALTFSIFSFWCTRGRERQGIWIGALFLLAGFHFFRMMSPYLAGSTYMYLFYAVIAGVGVADIFAVSPVSTAVEGRDAGEGVEAAQGRDAGDEVEAEEVICTGEEIRDEIEGMDEHIKEGETEPMEPMKLETGAAKVQLLENPLPLPKKHQPKVLDYKIKDVAAFDYDYDVSDEDDFDIK